ncbi:hypothetical protein, partial [Lentimicrobium sp.]
PVPATPSLTSSILSSSNSLILSFPHFHISTFSHSHILSLSPSSLIHFLECQQKLIPQSDLFSSGINFIYFCTFFSGLIPEPFPEK